MASPVNRGTLIGDPFLNNYVRVLHENLFITLDDTYDYAKFDIEYIIESEKDGINIPLLFYAYGYDADFVVLLDGKQITLKKFTDFWNSSKINKNKLTNFNILYTTDIEEVVNVNVDFDNGNSQRLRIKDFIYFETDLTKGKHIIKVSYKATAWSYKHSRLIETGYKYVLSPARFWKYFGTLDIKIDAQKLSSKIETNLGKPTKGTVKTIANYHFSEIPVDVISINFVPQISSFAKFLLKIEYFFIAIFFMLPLVYLHFKLMQKYRKQNSEKKLSAIAILGSLLLPSIFIFVLLFTSFFIDYFLGNYASGQVGYGAFFSFLFLPKFILYYLPFSLIVDYIFRKYYTNI